MKKFCHLKTIIICFICWAIVIILFNWFINEICEVLTPFLMFIPIISLLLLTVGFLVWAIIFCTINANNGLKKASIPIFFWLVIVLIWIFIPFSSLKVNIEYKLYTEKRLDVIHMIQNNELSDDGIGNITLPEKYKHISSDGEVYVYQNNSNGIIIGFWVNRGILTGPFTSVIYTSLNNDLNDETQEDFSIISKRKLGNHWYFIKAK